MERSINWRKEMFYLTMHSTHFYLRLYGIRHMVKDHSDSKRGNPLPPHGLLFSISCKGSFICIIHRQDNTYHGLCYTSRGALSGMSNSWMGPPWRIDPTTHCTMSECYYHPSVEGLCIQLEWTAHQKHACLTVVKKTFKPVSHKHIRDCNSLLLVWNAEFFHMLAG